MHMKTIRSLAYTGLIGLTTLAATTAMSVQAAQVLKPKSTAGAVLASQDGAGTISVPIGQTLYFDMEYSVTGNQTKDEAGIGLKVGYDTNFFDLVVPTTAVTALHTKCMIASPSDQAATGTLREVVFGWIDTSIRTTPTAGAVGWPGTADPAAPGATNGCLNPGSIVTESGALMASNAATLNLFRIGLKAKSSGLTVGSSTSTVTINTAGNISYASTGNADTSKTINVVAAAAPACNLDVDGDGQVLAAKDGILLQRALNPNVSDANVVAGITITGSRNTGALIRQYLNTFMSGVGVAANIGPSVLDVDGNSSTTSAVDGVAIKRALNVNVSAANVVAGLSLAAGTTGQSVRQYLNSTCGLSLPTN